MYGAIATTLIVIPVFVTALASLSTDIVEGTCIPWGVYASYAAEKAMIAAGFIFTYLLPLMTMLFCYSRIIYTMRLKVRCLLTVAFVMLIRFTVRLRVMQRTILPRPFCPSVSLSVKRVDCDKTKETFAHIFMPHESSSCTVSLRQLSFLLTLNSAG